MLVLFAQARESLRGVSSAYRGGALSVSGDLGARSNLNRSLNGKSGIGGARRASEVVAKSKGSRGALGADATGWLRRADFDREGAGSGPATLTEADRRAPSAQRFTKEHSGENQVAHAEEPGRHPGKFGARNFQRMFADLH